MMTQTLTQLALLLAVFVLSVGALSAAAVYALGGEGGDVMAGIILVGSFFFSGASFLLAFSVAI